MMPIMWPVCTRQIPKGKWKGVGGWEEVGVDGAFNVVSTEGDKNVLEVDSGDGRVSR